MLTKTTWCQCSESIPSDEFAYCAVNKCDYQVCEECGNLIQGTASTHVEDDEESDDET